MVYNGKQGYGMLQNFKIKFVVVVIIIRQFKFLCQKIYFIPLPRPVT